MAYKSSPYTSVIKVPHDTFSSSWQWQAILIHRNSYGRVWAPPLFREIQTEDLFCQQAPVRSSYAKQWVGVGRLIHSSDICWVVPMRHALKAEGAMPTNQYSPSQGQSMLLWFSLNIPICLDKILISHIIYAFIYFSIFLKSLPCNTNRTASQGQGATSCSSRS